MKYICILSLPPPPFKYVYIELFGKFVPMLKENWNAEDLNFSIY